jgi:hypothetical protein
VLHQVGAGVLGPVFRAHSADTDNEVAVKLFRLDLTPEQGRDLASALGRLCARLPDHPHIVAGRVTGVLGATAWMASAFVAADALDTRLRRRALVGLAHALPLLRQVAAALDAAAALGIHHGALHPRDVLVTTTGRVHVTGFGVAGALIATGLTPPVRRPYAPPERIAAPTLSPDAAGDVFSLGALAVEMLTGRRASGTGASAVGFVSGVGEGIDADVCRRALGRALAESPEDRFSSAGAFVAALSHALSGTEAAEAGVDDRAEDGAEEPAEDPVEDRAESRGEEQAADRVVERAGDEDEGVKNAARSAVDEVASSSPPPRPARPASRPRRSPEPRPAAELAASPTVVPAGAPVAKEAGDVAARAPVVDGDAVAPVSAGAGPVGGPAQGPDPTDAVDLFGMTALDRGREGVEARGDEVAGELPLEPEDAPASATPDWRRDLEARISARRAAAGRAAAAGSGPRRPFRDVPIRGGAGAPDEATNPAADADEAAAKESVSDGASEPWPVAPAPALDGRLKRGEAFGPDGLARSPTEPGGRPRPGAAEGARLLGAMFLGVAVGLLAGYGFWGTDASKGTGATPAGTTATAGTETPAGTDAEGAAGTGAATEEGRRGPEGTASPTVPAGVAETPVTKGATAGTAAPRSTPVPKSTPAPKSAAAPMTAPAPKTTAARPLAERPRTGPAILEVVSRPAGARVILDGRPVGTTPVRALDAAPGAHTIRLELPGHAPWTTTLRVAAGERARVAASLELLTLR